MLQNDTESTTPLEGQGSEKDTPAKVYVTIDPSLLFAELFIEPPTGNGAHADAGMISDALARAEVVYGLNQEALDELATPLYDKTLTVAEGIPAKNGVDGVCTEHFSREHGGALSEQEGTVNYRELGLIREVTPGTLICSCTPPTPGVDGVTVKGHPIKAIDGKKALPPVGDGIKTDPEGLRSEAAVDGNLVFRDGRFMVETVYRVNEVDYNVGNITFGGDVQVNGDILDGFEIHAGGTVTLKGQLGAVVVEGENVIIEKGINGNGKAVIDAKKTLKAEFIENCNLVVGEQLTASYLMNCVVECEGEIDVTRGKGIICGGKLTSFGSIKAKVIGNDSQTLTTITMGMAPKLLAERKKLEETQAQLEQHLAEIKKNMEYIERLVADGRPIPPDRIQFLQRSKIQVPMTEKKRDQIGEQIAELDDRMHQTQKVTLTAGTIYPPTKVSIGSQKKNIIEMQSHCRVYKDAEGEIVVGKA